MRITPPLLGQVGGHADLPRDAQRNPQHRSASALRPVASSARPVRTAVLNTPGITALVDATATAVAAFAAGPSAGAVTVADGCAGGRHRAPTFAGVLAERLRSEGYRVSVTHRDLHRPVVQR
ncbi:ATPase [Streptomyces sp. NPDC092903]|uniref:RapZ C-terminal domain-containing protein n=1 Tax=Streptomyces sp. NPDC092903 TaxID=3366017 RepID=UPI0037FE6D97